MKIRPATINDVNAILGFIKELAEYEKASHCVKASEKEIADSLFSEKASAKALICEINNEPVGYAVYFYNYSTWLGKNGLYLEDLYVTPSHRGTGAGKLLMKTLASIAVKNDCGRFEWSVLHWNQPAIDFYQHIGAEEQGEWRIYRLTGEALNRFAAD
ncbi:GNAT family N-acetyltransferase [Vibrio salinus]|uniref:GNAT family N-acetyltransferase n=1 Tax=Vibrio salinus TaxID=2899784 RepID=UPI001E5896D5|nr:GNAT family N-acetyltransferase [Vibrio salinus]MCE0496222.1 GNAT family N-acetyltransferase [Vibrio salinus]